MATRRKRDFIRIDGKLAKYGLADAGAALGVASGAEADIISTTGLS